ncbi:MAG: exodeoxyribonuclease VII large subunit [Actinomycetaceae bacterium]|nr:exodeoxyribonuclease VII large subunit [Actinomycetaceae bacterium]
MASSVRIPESLPQRAAQTTAERPWPLRLLSAKMEEYIDKMSHIWIEGEIIQYNARPGTKTQFITLKDCDEDISIQVSIFTYLIPSTIRPGDKVVVYAKPSYYGKRGSLSLWAQEIRLAGVGDILAQIEALKARLAAEGLFDEGRKKALPFLPKRIGLIGGRNAEGTRDVLVNARKRWASADFEVREVAVQGERAVPEVIAALAELDGIDDIDVIVIARGGGSLEDLLPFSDEQLVRAVAAASTPVVSAIGHERDIPLLDLVADVRASTPTDAARRIVPDVAEELAGIAEASQRARNALERHIDHSASEIASLRSRPVLASPHAMFESRREDIATLTSWLDAHTRRSIERQQAELSKALVTLRALSPHSTLKRGYSILVDSSKNVVSESVQTEKGENLTAILADGRLEVTVHDIIESRQGGASNG